jgi:hypothetical protein
MRLASDISFRGKVDSARSRVLFLAAGLGGFALTRIPPAPKMGVNITFDPEKLVNIVKRILTR